MKKYSSSYGNWSFKQPMIVLFAGATILNVSCISYISKNIVFFVFGFFVLSFGIFLFLHEFGKFWKEFVEYIETRTGNRFDYSKKSFIEVKIYFQDFCRLIETAEKFKIIV